eukprot:GHVU01216141.1.p2 GENE.GHVU01216141.1~~GHVU01216141.1.p2  ORF type:complete len:116 (+),score=3.85 GHVU01216141.1:36-383(+)
MWGACVCASCLCVCVHHECGAPCVRTDSVEARMRDAAEFSSRAAADVRVSDNLQSRGVASPRMWCVSPCEHQATHSLAHFPAHPISPSLIHLHTRPPPNPPTWLHVCMLCVSADA